MMHNPLYSNKKKNKEIENENMLAFPLKDRYLGLCGCALAKGCESDRKGILS